MRWVRFALAMALATGAGCIPADSNIVGPAPDSSVTCTSVCSALQRCVNGACIRDGLLRFTLTWDQPGDVDLHVVTPGGATINYRSRSAAGGTLDRDDQSGRGPENVYWSSTPPLGEYLVCVIPFAITQPTAYALDVRLPSGAVDRRTGSLTTTPGASTATCSRTSPFFVVAYTISLAAADGGVTDAAVPDASVPDAAVPDAPAADDIPAVPDAAVVADVPALEDVVAVGDGEATDAAAAD
jgi:hypothetical protein